MHSFTRSPRLAPLAAALLIALVAIPLLAQRTRPARRGPANPATLLGRVVDADTGAPVFEAVITAGDQIYVADSEGRFVVGNLPPGNVTIHIQRWGYEPKEESFLLRFGDNSLEFKLKPLPFATARLDDGTTYTLELQNLKFGNFFPFSGWSSSSTLQVCLPSGVKHGIELSQMKTITFGQTRTENTACCSLSPGAILRIEHVDGTLIDATSHGSCAGYDMYLLARNRANGAFERFRFLELDELILPH